MADDRPLPPAAVLITHPVADFDSWLTHFDAHESARRDNGIVAHHLNRAENDPNHVMGFLAVADEAKARAFAADPSLQAAMEAAGVTGPPQIEWLRPTSENAIWDRELPALVVRHAVADPDAWLTAYLANSDFRTSHGIIGDATNVSMDDANEVLVYHQAESFATLRSFAAMPELAQIMAEVGVVSEPVVDFWTGGWGKSYL